MDPNNLAETFGALKESGYHYRPIRQEMAENLAKRLGSGEKLLPQIHGYEQTVELQLVHAILAGHNIVIIGEKGQAKSRILRSLVLLLDPLFPVIAEAMLPESPFRPLTARGREIVERDGESTKLRYLSAEERYCEKLAPGSRMADIIGDIDPAKVINGASLGSEDALHYGLVPRSNHGIMAINELPDLDYLIQVGLFNILEERDLQIRGLPVRLEPDLFLGFTANPSDYSRSGKIVTQLKDRIGCEIRTHYPRSRETGIEIMLQEAKLPKIGPEVVVSDYLKEILEEITIQARLSPMVNQRSGVSARLSISNYETLIAAAKRRAIILHDELSHARITDLGHIYASSSGKIELDPYRDESITEYQVIRNLTDQAIKEIFSHYFSIERYERELEKIVEQVYAAGEVEVADTLPDSHYRALLSTIPALFDLLSDRGWDESDGALSSGIEFILEGLTCHGRLSRRQLGDMVRFRSVAIY